MEHNEIQQLTRITAPHLQMQSKLNPQYLDKQLTDFYIKKESTPPLQMKHGYVFNQYKLINKQV